MYAEWDPIIGEFLCRTAERTQVRRRKSILSLPIVPGPLCTLFLLGEGEVIRST